MIQLDAAISQHTNLNTYKVGLSVGKVSVFCRTFIGLSKFHNPLFHLLSQLPETLSAWELHCPTGTTQKA